MLSVFFYPLQIPSHPHATPTLPHLTALYQQHNILHTQGSQTYGIVTVRSNCARTDTVQFEKSLVARNWPFISPLVQEQAVGLLHINCTVKTCFKNTLLARIQFCFQTLSGPVRPLGFLAVRDCCRLCRLGSPKYNQGVAIRLPDITLVRSVS